jgi:5-formyltetrahydrofolate cyclo-ligase
MNHKNILRKLYIQKRKNISIHRKSLAEKKLIKTLINKTSPFKKVLSFSSKKEEIDLWILNDFLCKTGKLVLPKVHNFSLKLFNVTNLEKELIKSSHFSIWEPNETICQEISIKDIDIALIPGITFDKSHNRLGYGKGFYDRLLKNNNVKTIGISYIEQYYEKNLPTEKSDIPLTETILF